MGGARGCDELNETSAADRSSGGTSVQIRTKAGRPSTKTASTTSPAFVTIKQTTSSKSASSETPRTHGGSGGLAYASKDRLLTRTHSRNSRATGPRWRRRIRNPVPPNQDEVKYFSSDVPPALSICREIHALE